VPVVEKEREKKNQVVEKERNARQLKEFKDTKVCVCV